jgi:ankyrin repeat protein
LSTLSPSPAFAPPFGAHAPLHLGRQTAASFPCRPRHQASRRAAPPPPSLSTTLRGAAQNSDADEALIKACKTASPDAVRAALASGASPGAADDWGRTALQLGVKAGCAETAMVLLEAGADVSAASVGGDDDTTVLHTAALGGDRGMVELLLKNGADTAREASDTHMFAFSSISLAGGETAGGKERVCAFP